jgi:hypothetical protein
MVDDIDEGPILVPDNNYAIVTSTVCGPSIDADTTTESRGKAVESDSY